MKNIWFRFIHGIWNLKFKLASILGGKILGARALVIKDNEILLIRHTYDEGWYTIGGGVDKGETPLQSIKRELLEEVGLIVESDPELMGIYYNGSIKREDYVIFYVIKSFREMLKPIANSDEIAEKCWFKLDNLPKDISPATQRRIEEHLGKRSISENWSV